MTSMGIRRGNFCWLLWAILLPMLAGCATYADHIHELREDYFTGNLPAADRKIAERLEKKRKETDVLKLERAMVELSSGRPADAERSLREVRDQFDHLEQKSAAELGAAMLLDDTQLSYAGEDYEKVLIRAFLSLSNLMHDGGDAYAYALQVTDKQNQIIHTGTIESGENPKLAYNRVALGAYLHGVLCEQSRQNHDDMTRAYAKVVSWQPDFPHGPADLARVSGGLHSAPGNGVVYIFTLVGRGPYKEETIEVPSTVALLVADRILTATGKHSLPPNIAPIKVPQLVRSWNQIQHVQVAIDGQPAGSTATITDISELACQQYDAVYPQILGRAIARRVVKKGVVYVGKELTGMQKGSLANLAVDLTGVAWEATEAADTRCWGFLPDTIQVLRVELPAGTHTISLTPAGRFTTPASSHSQSVTVLNGRNTYVLANFPDARLAGQITTNTP